MEFFKKILDAIICKLPYITVALCDAVSGTFNYLSKKSDIKQKSARQKRKRDVDRQIDRVTEKGRIEDLIDVSKKIKAVLLITCLCSLAGCVTNEIVIEPTAQWEGHYYSSKDATAAISGVKLNRDESIWILSNKTLNRVLKGNNNE